MRYRNRSMPEIQQATAAVGMIHQGLAQRNTTPTAVPNTATQASTNLPMGEG